MESVNQARVGIAEMQKHAAFPLLISTDEEGGTVHRLSNIYPSRPGATEISQTGDVRLAAHQGAQTAHDLRALGINADIAPDVDVAFIDGPAHAWRTFGSTPETA